MKKLRLRKSVLVLFTVLILMFGAILAAPKISKTLKEAFSVKEEKAVDFDRYDTYSTSFYSNDTHGAWNFSAVVTSSNAELFSNGSQILYHASDMSSVDNNKISVQYNASYVFGTASVDFDPGELMVAVPALMFNTVDIAECTIDYDDVNNVVSFSKDGAVIAKIDLGDLKQIDYDNYGSTGDVFAADALGVGYGELDIYNDQFLSKDESIDLSFTIDYYFSPEAFYAEDYVSELNPYILVFDNGNQNDEALFFNLYLVSTIDANGQPSGSENINFTRYNSTLYETWQNKWGVNNGYDEDYYFLEYAIGTNVSKTSSYDVSFDLTNNDGTIVAYGDGDNYATGADWNASTMVFNPLSDSVFAGFNGEVASGTHVSRNVVVAYERPDVGESKNSYFKIVANVNEYSHDYEWDYTYINSQQEIQYPAGVSSNILNRVIDDSEANVALTKLKQGGSFEATFLVEAGTDNINKDNNGNNVKAFNIWNLTNEGTTDVDVNLIVNKSYLSNALGDTGTLNELSDSDFDIVSMYPQDDREYDYIEGTEQYVLKENTQYNSYSEKEVYAEVNNTWEHVGVYKKTATGIMYTPDGGSARLVNEENPIVLPEGTKGVNVLAAGSKAAVYVGYNVTYKVNGTSHVKNLLDDLSNSDVIFKEKAFVQFQSENKSESLAGTTLYELESESFLNVSGEVLGRENNVDTVSYTVSGFEQIQYGNDLDSAIELINKQEDAIFYVLLPEGGEVSNVKVNYYHGDEITSVDSQVTDSYYDGRSLLTVTFNPTSDSPFVTGNYVQYGYTLTYDLTYSARANQTYGTTLVSDVVYTSDNLSSGYDSIEELPTTSFSSGSVQNGLKRLDVNNKVMAANITKEVDPISVGVGSYHKEVNVENVKESKEYTYTLQYTYSSQLDIVKNLLFVDILDSANTDSNYFKGILKNVDTSYLNGKGVSTTVYYTTSNIDISNVDVTDSIWTTTPPSSLETVKAVAISTGNYEFSQSNGVAPKVDIKMVAPNGYVENRTLVASNQSVLKYVDYNNANASLSSEKTNVTLDKANIDLDINYRNSINDLTNEGKGSSTNPIIISGDYGYYVTLRNNDNVDYSDISIMNVLPEGLLLDGNVSMVEGLDFDQTVTGQNVKLTVNQLGANQTLHFWIPITIDDDSNFEVLDNVASMVSLGNRSYSGSQIHVYTKAAVPVLEFDKYVKTISNGEYAKDEVFVLSNNETYSYMIKVDNTSVLDANNVEVVDNVPEGLIVKEDTITNGGIYNSSNNTIKWIVNVNKNSSVELKYSVTLPSDAELGTYYNSKGHVTFTNPLNVSNKLYDDDTNSISVYYQVVTDITIKNNVTGAIGDKTKEFNYVITLDGEESHVGEYNVINGAKEVIGKVNVGSDGNGEYSFSLKDNEQVTIKLLPGNMNYSIAQSEAPGYTTTNSVNNSNAINGVTDSSGNVSYTFTNSYSAIGTTRINAKVTYDKGVTEGLFKVELEDPDGATTEALIDASGNVVFDNITIENAVGSYEYKLRQVNTNVKQVSYDNREFTAKLNVTDRQDGNLDIQVNYYDNNGEEVSEVVFENEYVPLGLTIVNNNNSKYVDPDKEFNYVISVAEVLTGTYDIVKNGDKIGELVVDDDGLGTANITLKSNDVVTIVDINDHSFYEIKQEQVDYYETTATNGTVDGNYVVVVGDVLGDSVQVEFINTYNTTATFKPESKVVLEEKLLEDQEFSFALVDISAGSTNGYRDEVSNDENGLLDFKEIVYDRPGTYIYKIAQVKGTSNHIYYDLTSCLLTVTLTDNGDGTMSYDFVYNYENGKTEFVNKYSVDPIVVDPEPTNDEGPTNPNTIDYIIVVILSLILTINIFIILKGSRVRKFNS
jgi:pilin isopeptide linkage protein/uncharacterized repeat protein (TIGR01451 family)